jgi:4-amino-4-deoxy-L-arabinose transferase-like glycosyltransferase
MSFATRPSPARVTTAAATPFPRAALWALLIIFIATGLFGRDPWYQEDAAGFGAMWTMAHGTSTDWWLPNVEGVFLTDGGPLAYWVGAVFIRLFGPWLGEVNAARLAAGGWFLLTTAAVWYSTYRLARRDEAQPVAFAFGGEAQPRDYGRMIADIATLLFIATIGLVVRVHETNDLIATTAFVGLTLYGLVGGLRRPLRGAVTTGLGLGLLALTQGPLAAAVVTLGALAGMLITWPRGHRTQAIAVTLAIACAVAAIWPLGALSTPAPMRSGFIDAWQAAAAHSLVPPDLDALFWIGKTVAWYDWPLWPFALWALYAWRQGLGQAHIAIPSMMAAAIQASSILSRQAELPLLMMSVPLATLGAFGAVSVRRALESAIDWFSIVLFSCVMLIGWGYFIAMQTGTPPKMAASIARLAPGYVPDVGGVSIGAALLISVGWIGLVVWRIARQPEMLWRGPLLAAVGLAAHWFILNALFLPATDYKRSYRPIALQIKHEAITAAGADACVFPYDLRPAHVAVLAYHGAIRFGSESDHCPLALQRDSRRTSEDDAPPPGNWTRIWETRWPGRPDELFYLYRRRPS